VAVEIDPPTTVRAVTDVLWYLYHERVSVYLDGDGDWSVVFETRCRHLTHDRRCGIYPQRPRICRTFDNTTCEVNSADEGRTFTTAEDFLAWLQLRRRRLYARVARQFVPPRC
jgi:Fe-S-cluster containining protein